jgi:archaellum component FlaC
VTEPTPEPTVEELRRLVEELRAEVARLKEELRRARRDQHEVPPHYL